MESSSQKLSVRVSAVFGDLFKISLNSFLGTSKYLSALSSRNLVFRCSSFQVLVGYIEPVANGRAEIEIHLGSFVCVADVIRLAGERNKVLIAVFSGMSCITFHIDVLFYSPIKNSSYKMCIGNIYVV